MADQQTPEVPAGQSGCTNERTYLAVGILACSILGIVAVAGVAICKKPDQAMTILNVILPVAASWVGTILAFYFGRENFESANVQVREIIRRFGPEEKAKALVTDAMRPFSRTDHVVIPDGKSEVDLKITDLRAKFSKAVSRVPVVTGKDFPKYIVHSSSVDRYLAAGGATTGTLADFLANQKGAGFEFGAGKGFVVVSETTTVAVAKTKMEQVQNCQDILVTKGGTTDEPVLGWISNVRLGRYLQA